MKHAYLLGYELRHPFLPLCRCLLYILISPPPDGSNLEMKWSCGHEGYLNLDWLRKHCYSAKNLQEGREKTTPLFATQVANSCISVYSFVS